MRIFSPRSSVSLPSAPTTRIVCGSTKLAVAGEARHVAQVEPRLGARALGGGDVASRAA